MNIYWHGHSCFRITEKIGADEVAVVTDPYGKSVGLFPPKLKADIVTVSQDNDEANYLDKISGNLSQRPFIIDRSGEYEIKGVYITSVDDLPETKAGKTVRVNILFRYEINGISVVHLGQLKEKLTVEQIDEIGDVDILLIPVGGGAVLDGSKAAEVVRQIEPRIVIPMHYKINGVTLNLDNEKKFLKEMGGKEELLPKLKVARKDLPEDNIKVVILEKI